MSQGISEVLTYAVAVAISLLAMVAVILMLFSSRAKVNGPAFLVGWMLTLAVVSGVVYVACNQGNAATNTTTSDTISWGKIVFGVLLLLLAGRNWRNRPGARCRARDAEVDGQRRHAFAGKGVRLRGAHGWREPEEPAPDRRRGRGTRAARAVDERGGRLADRVRRGREPHDRRARSSTTSSAANERRPNSTR